MARLLRGLDIKSAGNTTFKLALGNIYSRRI
jgi:hypothetical protein